MKLAVLGSGKGSNFEAIHKAIHTGRLPAQIASVISDKADSVILEKARSLNIPSRHIPANDPGSLLSFLVQIAPDYIVLAGYMRILPDEVVHAFPQKIINVHPSLLPAFPGLNAPRKALESKAQESGCTVHFVDTGVDTGQIIAQSKVPILGDDTPHSLHLRIQEAEHKLLPEVLLDLSRRI